MNSTTEDPIVFQSQLIIQKKRKNFTDLQNFFFNLLLTGSSGKKKRLEKDKNKALSVGRPII